MDKDKETNTPGDFMTPQQAADKLRSLGYDDFRFVPKGSHLLQAYYEIAISSSGGSVSEYRERLQATDPRHQKKLREFRNSMLNTYTNKSKPLVNKYIDKGGSEIKKKPW